MTLLGVVFLLGCQPVVPDDEEPDTFTDPKQVAAKIAAPAGVTLPLADLVVSTIAGDAAVGEDGTVKPTVITSTPSFAAVIEPGGKVVLIGFLSSDGSVSELGARSTAQALLFFSVGGFGLPPQGIDDLLDLIAGSAALGQLTTAVEQALLANPTVVTDGAETLESAIAAAHQLLLTEADAANVNARRIPGGAGPAQASLADADADKLARQYQAGGGLPILLEPDANTVKSGIQVVQNDQGPGIVALNNFRRRATLFIYQVGSLAEGAEESSFIYPPVQIGSPIEVPGTTRLSALTSIGSITGNVPWAPVRSDAVNLPMRENSTQTDYKIVVVGPSLGGITGLAYSDSQLILSQPDWNAKINDLQYEMMLWDFLIPIVEFVSVGVGTTVPVNVRAGSVAGFKAFLDPELAAAGIALDITRSSGLRTFIKSLLEDLANPARREFARGLLSNILAQDAELAARSISLQQMERGLVATLAARTVLVAVDIAMGALDSHAVLNDLSQSSRDEVWEATVIQRRVNLEPTSVTLTGGSEDALFTASVNGLPNSTFLYRWSTTGANGRIFDAFGKQGTEFDSTDKTIQYIANAGNLPEGQIDTVTVEVFEDNANDVIPSGATPIGSATSIVRGKSEDDCGALNIVTRPSTPYFRIDIPQTVSRGSLMEVVITIDGPAIRTALGVDSQVVLDRLTVSGAFEAALGANQTQILVDGAQYLSQPIANITSGSIGSISISPTQSIMVNQSLVIDGGPIIDFNTNGVQTRTVSVPISTNALFPCSEFAASFVTVQIQVSREANPQLANIYAYEQFRITD